MNTIIDLKILYDHPEALAKVTQALAQVYFDNVLNDEVDIKPLDEAYSKAFRLCPNYRTILPESISFPKYESVRKQKRLAEITSLPYQPLKSLIK